VRSALLEAGDEREEAKSLKDVNENPDIIEEESMPPKDKTAEVYELDELTKNL
jgi:hypothetical protein